MTDLLLGGDHSVYRGCELPPELLYDVERDVWLRTGDDGLLTMGMTDPAQSRSGKLLHIQFKRVGRHLDAGQSAATIETAKWAGPFPTPVSGTIMATNQEAYQADILVANRDPYGAGWLVRIQPDAWPASDAPLVSGAEAMDRYRSRIDELDLTCFRCED